MDKKNQILNFLKKHTLAVIATVGAQDAPEAAAIEFGFTDEFEIIFDTFEKSRKYKNILQNNKVALVVGWDDDVTVQYEGEAFVINGHEEEKLKQVYFAKNPRAKKWEKGEGMRYIKIVPTLIRYSDLTKDPWEVFEVTF